MINLKCYSPIFEHFVYHNESVVLNSIQDDRSLSIAAEEGTPDWRKLKNKHPRSKMKAVRKHFACALKDNKYYSHQLARE